MCTLKERDRDGSKAELENIALITLKYHVLRLLRSQMCLSKPNFTRPAAISYEQKIHIQELHLTELALK